MTAATTEQNANTSARERRATSYGHKPGILSRLRRLEGQVRGVHRMVEEDASCVDVLTQFSAIIAAARQTGLLVLEDHMRGGVLGTCQHGRADREDVLEELTEAVARFTRVVR